MKCVKLSVPPMLRDAANERPDRQDFMIVFHREACVWCDREELGGGSRLKHEQKLGFQHYGTQFR